MKGKLGPEPVYHLVLRERMQNGQWRMVMWSGAQRHQALRQLGRHLTRTSRRKLLAWCDGAEAYVLANYNTMSKALLAKELRKRYHQPFTKNAVISKYHHLTGNFRNHDH